MRTEYASVKEILQALSVAGSPAFVALSAQQVLLGRSQRAVSVERKDGERLFRVRGHSSGSPQLPTPDRSLGHVTGKNMQSANMWGDFPHVQQCACFLVSTAGAVSGLSSLQFPVEK